MGLLSHLEVKITLKNDIYRATCDSFPKCSGSGHTQEDALEKLSASISRFVGALVKNTFTKLLKSDRYTELILDTTNDHQQKRVYPMDPTMSQFTKSVFIRVKSEENVSKSGPVLDMQSFVKQLDMQRNDDDSDILEKHVQAEGDSENYVFGFPVSFN